MQDFSFGTKSKAKLYGDDTHPGVHPDVAAMCEKALDISRYDFSIIDGVRTAEEQKKMYDDGVSELDGVNKISDHQRRLAIDVYPLARVDGKRVNMYDIRDQFVVSVWLEIYRSFLRAARLKGLVLELGLTYDMRSPTSHDWPHISIKGRVPADYSGMEVLD